MKLLTYCKKKKNKNPPAVTNSYVLLYHTELYINTAGCIEEVRRILRYSSVCGIKIVPTIPMQWYVSVDSLNYFSLCGNKGI